MSTNFRPGFRDRFRRNEPQDAHRINRRITAQQVRVVTEEGEQLGVLPIRTAIQAAEDRGLDLVEVAATANPPVCKIMDYGKFKYREQKKESEAKKKRTETELKELRLRYNTGAGDLEVKLKKAREFLDEGNKVKFSIRFRGREIAFQDLAQEKFKTIIANLADIATIDEKSPAQGRQVHIVLAPGKLQPKK